MENCFVLPNENYIGLHDAIQKLKQQQDIFENPVWIIWDREAAFTSKEFKYYCEYENIKHITITTEVSRGNEKIERLHAIIIPVLSKLSIEKQKKNGTSM